MMLVNSILYLAFAILVNSNYGIVNEVIVQMVLLFTVYRLMYPNHAKKRITQTVFQKHTLRRKPKDMDYDRYVFLRKQAQEKKSIIQKIDAYTHHFLHFDMRKHFKKK